MRVLIVGGGISGLLSAYELSGSGHHVTLLDRREVGREASWAGGGILTPLKPWEAPEPVMRLVRWSWRRYPELVGEVERESGIDPEFWRCGLLWIGVPPEIAKTLPSGRWLSKGAVAEALPGLAEPKGGVFSPEIAQVRNPKLLQALKVALSRRGVALLERTPVVGWRIERGRIAGVETNRGIFSADLYLLAAGAWSRKLLEGFGVSLPEIWPAKGQMLLFEAPGWLDRMVMAGDHYLIPRRDGKLLVGSTVEVSEVPLPTADALRKLHRFALSLFPRLRRAPLIAQWAGLRPAAPRGIPYIGRHPEIPNLYLNCGHFRNGVVMAPASARLVVDLMEGRPPIVEPKPFDPALRMARS